MHKLIFRTQKEPPEPRPLPDGWRMVIAEGIAGAIALAPALFRSYGLGRGTKALTKIATPSRAYYAILNNGLIASDGWITFGFCRAYKIGRQDHVIGPIFTADQHRGAGLAVYALKCAVRYSINRGARWVYIDTADNNIASQRTILGAGFQLLDADQVTQ